MNVPFDATEHHIFAGLRCVRPSWSHSNERFFRREEFLLVVHRCHALGFEIYGLEVFTQAGEWVAVEINPGTPGASWVKEVVIRLTAPGLLCSATYAPSRRFLEAP